MEAFMVHFRGIRIERAEFEIAKHYWSFRRLQRPRVLTLVSALALFEKITDGQNFLLDVALAGQIVSGDKLRKMQEKPTTQGQRIYCPLARVQEDLVLIGAHTCYQVVYGG